MMKGIKAFHKSVNGKRFHRKLGRFLASRITRKANESLNYQGFLEQLDFLVGLNSVKQHLYVEMDYFHQAQEQIELEEMVLEYALPFFRTIEEKIVENRELTEDELIFLMDLTDTQEFMEAVAETSGVSLTEVSTVYTAIEENLVKEGIAKDDKQFYPVLVKRLCAHNWRSVSEN